MKEKMRQELKKIRPFNIFMLLVAGMVNAFAATFFLMPVSLYDSGISGTSMLLSQLTPEYLGLSVFLLVFNIPLFIYGLKKQGVLFTLYSIFTVAIYSLSAYLITDVLPINIGSASPIAGKDLLLCAVFGGIISGVGSGLAIRFGGAMDGIEVMAVIFAKKLGISVGTFVMVYNIILYVVCGIVTMSWSLPLYSIMAYAAALKTVDFIVEGVDRSKCAMIVTVQPDKICKILSETFETGVTRTEAMGGYSKKKKTIVYFVINRFQVVKLKELVHEIDPSSYITISEVADVFPANKDE